MTDDPLNEFGPDQSVMANLPKKPRPKQGLGRNAGLSAFEKQAALDQHVKDVREAKRLETVTHRAAIAAKKPKPGMCQINLQLQHSVNGKGYGPGLVTVNQHLAAHFLSTESRAAEKEISLVQQQAFIVTFVNGMPVKRQVPWAQFDRIMGSTEVPLDTMGG